jgi:geranylgeranyl diphosphate synthase type I
VTGPLIAADREGRLLALQEKYNPLIEAEMKRALAGRDLIHYGLMRYHLGWEDRDGSPHQAFQGKMLRPLLCLASCGAVGGESGRAVPAAAALELLHNFSLIHDDIEDGSPRRHGRDTVWQVWGVAQAVNAGDGMFALAQVTLHRLSEVGLAADQVLAVARLLGEASLRLCEGQYRDLSYEEKPDVRCDDYLEMVAGKTAALMAASAASGALIGNAPGGVVSLFEELGRNLGFAFQIRDDILGIWGEAAETGKPTGEDIWTRKKSFPIVYALERAAERDREILRAVYGKQGLDDEDVAVVSAVLQRADARAGSQQVAAEYASKALHHLDGLDLVPERQRDLEALADYFVSREA